MEADGTPRLVQTDYVSKPKPRRLSVLQRRHDILSGSVDELTRHRGLDLS